MKNLLLSSIVTLFISFYGNSQIIKETGNYEQDIIQVDKNISLLNKVGFIEFSEYSYDLQRYMFVKFESSNKARLWKERIDYFILKSKITQDQKKLLDELKGLITETIYKGDSEKKQMENWIDKNVKAFGRDELSFVVNTMKKNIDPGQISNPINPSNPSPSTSTLSCNCSQTSDWCSSSSYCKTWSCNLVGSGCGTFWSYDCNGRCYAPNN